MIYYFGYYTVNGNPNSFRMFPGCNVKMSYIVKTLKKNGFSLKVICLGESFKYNRRKIYKIDEFEDNLYVATLPTRILSRIFLYIQIIYYLLFVVQSDDKVLFYHTLSLLPIFKIARKLKKFHLIVEVEENYSAVWGRGSSEINKELKLLKGADGYIYINDIIPHYIDVEVPYVICYGNYQIKSDEFVINNVGYKVKLLYAGLISDNGDVYLAIDAMRFLSEYYELSIIGYGSEDHINNMKTYIAEYDNIQYMGFFSGNDYDIFVQKHQIALNPRVLEDKLSNYTFPSKVLSYLTNNLMVVSTPIRCIQESKLGNVIYFSKDSTAFEFAQAISKAYTNSVDILNILSELDNKFSDDLRRLFI